MEAGRAWSQENGYGAFDFLLAGKDIPSKYTQRPFRTE
jgi:hypothetical protein